MHILRDVTEQRKVGCEIEQDKNRKGKSKKCITYFFLSVLKKTKVKEEERRD